MTDYNSLKKIDDLLSYLQVFDLRVWSTGLFVGDYLVLDTPSRYTLRGVYLNKEIVTAMVGGRRNCFFTPSNFKRLSFDRSQWSTIDGRIGLFSPDVILDDSTSFRALSIGLLYLSGLIDFQMFIEIIITIKLRDGYGFVVAEEKRNYLLLSVLKK